MDLLQAANVESIKVLIPGVDGQVCAKLIILKLVTVNLDCRQSSFWMVTYLPGQLNYTLCESLGFRFNFGASLAQSRKRAGKNINKKYLLTS